MTYYNALGTVNQILSKHYKNCIIVSEGANTMDMTRMLVQSYMPRRRLDAGTFAVMGPAMGYAIASQVCFCYIINYLTYIQI